MRIELGLDFNDKEYERALARALNGEFVIHTGSVTKGEILLTDGYTGRRDSIILGSDMRTEGVNILRQRILEKYCDIYGGYEVMTELRECTDICFFSPAGGTGCSTLAYHLAAELQSEGLLTMYVTFDDIPLDLSAGKGTSNINEAVYMMSEGRDIREMLPSFTYTDSCGVTHLRYLPPYNYMNMTDPETMRRFLETLASVYDGMVIDAGSKVNELIKSVISGVSKRVMVTASSTANEDKYIQYMDVSVDIRVSNMSDTGEGVNIPILEDKELSPEGVLGMHIRELAGQLNGSKGNI